MIDQIFTQCRRSSEKKPCGERRSVVENTHPRASCACVCVCWGGGGIWKNTLCCQRIKMLFFLVEAVLPSKALCQCGAAVCCRSDALGILTASLAGFVDDPLCFNPELNNRHWVILKQHSCEIPRICTWTWSSCVCCIAGLLRCGQAGLQWGWRQTLRKSVQSFGFSYISENFSLIKTSGSVPWGHRRALQDLTSAIDFFFFFFSSCELNPLKLHQLPQRKREWRRKCTQDCIIRLQSRACLCSFEVTS